MENKIKNSKELEVLIEKLQIEGKKVAFTNGCFDILHVGHIRYLNQASQFGDLMVVALNSDKSVQKLKGSKRPIIKEEDRLEVIAALEMVDYVTLFDEVTCSKLLQRFQPNIYVKGGDYNSENLPEWNTVKEYGGEIRFVELVAGRATSDIIKRIRGVEI